MAAEKGYKIFIIGGKDGIAEQAKQKLEVKHPNIRIVGTYAPPFEFEKNDGELNKINQMISEMHPDLLIACFGCLNRKNGYMRTSKNMMPRYQFVPVLQLTFLRVM